MADSNIIPKFKYITLLCYQVRDIFIIYGPTRYRFFHKNHQHVQGWNLTKRKRKIINMIFKIFSEINK